MGKTGKKRTILFIAAEIILIAGVLGGYAIWDSMQPKFHDLVIELGTESVSIGDFYTAGDKNASVSFVSDVSVIDLNQVGVTEITLKSGTRTATVTLTVQDTTPPEVTFLDCVTLPAGEEPDAADFVESVTDLSDVTISFAQPVVTNGSYEDVTVTVVVEDASRNAVSKDCTLSYTWLAPSVELELGEYLTKSMILVDSSASGLLSQADINEINLSGVGEYTLVSTSGNKTQTCLVTVQDTTGPTLTLQEVYTQPKGKVSLNDFVVSATDASGDVTLTLLTDFDTGTVGTYPVTIEAADPYGNVTTAETNLVVTSDTTPPVFSGGSSTITLDKHSAAPDYLSGVSAKDAVDGAVSVSVNDSGVNYDQAGTYYVTYSATDLSGNTATLKRKVVISHDADDTAALVASIMAGFSNPTVKQLQQYVLNHVSYNHDWGGDDPVWYGFTNKVGNCYVHATCLKALLDYAGYENQLIWVLPQYEPHYWNLVYYEGKWHHVDSTPSRNYHQRLGGIMNDAERLSTLGGRTWDHSAWPAAE